MAWHWHVISPVPFGTTSQAARRTILKSGRPWMGLKDPTDIRKTARWNGSAMVESWGLHGNGSPTGFFNVHRLKWWDFSIAMLVYNLRYKTSGGYTKRNIKELQYILVCIAIKELDFVSTSILNTYHFGVLDCIKGLNPTWWFVCCAHVF